MDFSDPATYFLIVTSIVTGASLIVKGLAVWTDITPGTRDDEIIDQVEGYIKKVQKILGSIALDTSKQR